MKIFKTAIDGTGTTTVVGRIHSLNTLLRVEALTGFDELEIQVTGMTNAHLNFIK